MNRTTKWLMLAAVSIGLLLAITFVIAQAKITSKPDTLEEIKQQLDRQAVEPLVLRLCTSAAKSTDANTQGVILADHQVTLARLLTLRIFNDPNVNAQALGMVMHEKCTTILGEEIALIESDNISKDTIKDLAFNLADRAAELSKGLNANIVYSDALGVHWFYYNFKNEHAKAEQLARKAIEFHPKDQALVNLSEKYSFLGTSLLDQGKFSESILYMRKGLALLLQEGVVDVIPNVHAPIAIAYLKSGNYQSARRYFQKAIDTQKTPQVLSQDCKDNSLLTAMAHTQLGRLSRLEGDSNKALIYLHCALDILENVSSYYLVVARIEKAKVLLNLGMVEEAVAITEQYAFNDDVMDIQVLDALLVLLQSQHAGNTSHVDKKLEQTLIERVGDDIEQSSYPVEFIQLTTLQMIHAAAKSDKKAFLLSAEKGFSAIDKIKHSIVDKDSWMATQYRFVEEYINAVFTHHLFEDDQAFDTIIKILEIHYSVTDYSDGKFLPSSDETVEDKQSQMLWQKLLADERRLVMSNPKNKLIVQAEVDASEELWLDAKPKTLASDTRVSHLKNFSLSSVQQSLEIDEVIVRYFISEYQAMAFVVSKSDRKIYHLPNVSKIRKWLKQLQTGFGQYSLTRKLRNIEMRQILPAELIAAKEVKKLIIIPDDVLHRFPFSALNVESSSDYYTPLSMTKRIVRTPSIYHYMADKRDPIKAVKDVESQITVFADPNFDVSKDKAELSGWYSSLVDLSYSADEAQSIETVFGKRRVQKYTQKQVTNEMLMSDTSRNSTILHIASHGYYDPLTPKVVGIATALSSQDDNGSDGFMSINHMLSKPFKSDLVVISGCETMLGEYYKGLGMKSLTHGLLVNGVGAVLGTLWKVSDESTSIFMKHFYQALAANDGDVSVALSTAKTKMLADDYYSDPYYWAGFVLTTDNQHNEKLTLN